MVSATSVLLVATAAVGANASLMHPREKYEVNVSDTRYLRNTTKRTNVLEELADTSTHHDDDIIIIYIALLEALLYVTECIAAI